METDSRRQRNRPGGRGRRIAVRRPELVITVKYFVGESQLRFHEHPSVGLVWRQAH